MAALAGEISDFGIYESDEDDIAVSFDTYHELSDNELELLGLLVPLGSVSQISGLDEDTLRDSVRITQVSPEKLGYSLIERYILNGDCHSFNLSLHRLFKINQFKDDKISYEKKNRMLLWHGTKQCNLASILQFGLRLPQHKPQRQMYGCGLYLADRVSKSVQYCNVPNVAGTRAYLVLCDVNLGNIHSVTTAYNYLKNPPQGCDSVKGVGRNIPDEDDFLCYHGCAIPFGKTISNARNTNSLLKYNEYIVYDVNRIIIKYIVEVTFS